MTCAGAGASWARWHAVPPVQGRPMTAQDVVFSYQRLATPRWPNADLLAGVASLRAEDARTVRITLERPDADFPPGWPMAMPRWWRRRRSRCMGT